MKTRTLVLWYISQILVALLTFAAFFSFAPWLATQPISEASSEARAALPKDCPAFEVGHGIYNCAWRGTIAMNPVGFSINTFILVSCLSFLFFTGFTGRGFPIKPLFSKTKNTPPNSSASG